MKTNKHKIKEYLKPSEPCGYLAAKHYCVTKPWLIASTNQEGEEHADRGEEVPNVVSVVEIQQQARPIAFTRLSRRQL
jgi:hypothetical protein